MHPAVIVALLGAGGAFAALDKKRSERVRDRHRIRSEHQGPFYSGLTENGENLWIYEQDDGSVIDVIEAPPLEAQDPQFQAWYQNSPLKDAVKYAWLLEQIGKPTSYRTLFFLLPDGAILGAEIDPDDPAGTYTIRGDAVHEMVTPNLIAPSCGACGATMAAEASAWRCTECGEADTENPPQVAFDVGLAQGFVQTIPCRDPGQAPRPKWMII
jgi:hypothetical protein